MRITGKTHRFAGRIWLVGGSFLFALSYFKADVQSAVIVVLGAMLVVPIVYSYLLNRAEKK